MRVALNAAATNEDIAAALKAVDALGMDDVSHAVRGSMDWRRLAGITPVRAEQRALSDEERDRRNRATQAVNRDGDLYYISCPTCGDVELYSCEDDLKPDEFVCQQKHRFRVPREDGWAEKGSSRWRNKAKYRGYDPPLDGPDYHPDTGRDAHGHRQYIIIEPDGSEHPARPDLDTIERDDMPGMTSGSPGVRPPQVGVPRPPRINPTNEPFLAAGGHEDPYQPPKLG